LKQEDDQLTFAEYAFTLICRVLINLAFTENSVPFLSYFAFPKLPDLSMNQLLIQSYGIEKAQQGHNSSICRQRFLPTRT
jgi:hypothetical protein